MRVKVPLRQSTRAGFVWEKQPDPEMGSKGGKLREIIEVLDEVPPLPYETRKTITWLGNRLPYGLGHALRFSCPLPLLQGKPVRLPSRSAENKAVGQRSSPCYLAREKDRFKAYLEAIENEAGGCLILFPSRESLDSFHNFLPEKEKNRTCVWPVGGGEGLWKSWLAVRLGEVEIVLGTSGAIFAPVQNLSLIVVEEEADPGHQMPPFPRISGRTVAAKRAFYSGAGLILGGTSPSARVAMAMKPDCPDSPKGRVFFVKPYSGFRDESAPVPFLQEIPVSGKLLNETRRCLENGFHAFWLLDRKGYAGELRCKDCGRTITCKECGGRARWSLSSSKGVCQSCGKQLPWPDECPYCRSPMLEIRHPGLEMSHDRARESFRDFPVFLMADYNGLGKRAKRKLIGEIRRAPSILLGTRSLLGLSRELEIGLVGWLDADQESWKPDYGAKAEGFRLIWSSCWVGKNPDKRIVILQSRNPKKGWQVAIEAGFKYFWKNELYERKQLEFPPFSFLVEIFPDKDALSGLEKVLEKNGVEILTGDDTNSSIKIRVNDLEKFRRILSPYFGVKSLSRGYPRLSVDFE